MNEAKDDIIKDLIPRYLAGESSGEEEKQVLAWIDQSDENKEHFLGSKKIFDLSQQHYKTNSSENLDINIDAEWSHFVNNISNSKGKTIEFPKPERNIQRWYQIAAAVLIVAVSGFLLNYYLNKQTDFNFETAGNTLEVLLPDGSHVTLNQYSRISYTSSFGETNRSVTLKGEAFFDVTHNTDKPFIISASKARIEVVGTSFDVMAYDSLEHVEVTVQTGIVKVAVPETNEEVKLTAGQKGIVGKEKLKLTSGENDNPNFNSWNTQKIVFTETDLQTVINTINKTYHTKIKISSAVAATCDVTVTFDHQNLDAVLNVLETTLNLTYSRNGDEIEITNAGC